MDDSQEVGGRGLTICCIMSSPQDIRMYTRARSRRRLLDVDLNAAPPCETREQGAVPTNTRSQGRQDAGRNSTIPPPIDLEAIDDDVVISSPTAFAEVYQCCFLIILLCISVQLLF